MPARSSHDRYFTPEAFRFLRELAKNNHREWFQANKPRYEAEVQQPALRFIADMGPRLGRLSRRVVADPKPFGGSLMRIYRDTRFAKDKSPYRTIVGIRFPHDAATDEEHLPGFSFHMAPGENWVAAGIWHPAPPTVKKIRDAIVRSPSAWRAVLRRGIEIDGESSARVPAGYDPSHPLATDLRRKDFYSWLPFTDAQVVGAEFGDRFVAACEQLNPLNVFLAKATGVPW